MTQTTQTTQATQATQATQTAPADHPLCGAIVRDATVTDKTVRYAIGKQGFMDLSTGDFLHYDAAFPGPQFFDNDKFEVEYAERRQMSDDAAEALDTLHWRYTQFVEARTPILQASALIEVHNAMGDMISWHPGYQYEHEHTQMPWQRTEQD